MLLIPENILNIPIDFISIAFPVEMCKGNTTLGGYGKDGAPVGTGRGCAPLCGAGNTPPIFFGLAKENGPRPVQKKNAFVSKSFPSVRFGQDGGRARWCPEN